jgi:hypothetical protein
MITTERQNMSPSMGRMILLFNSTILQGDCHSVEKLFIFEALINNEQSQCSNEEGKQKKKGAGQQKYGWD